MTCPEEVSGPSPSYAFFFLSFFFYLFLCSHLNIKDRVPSHLLFPLTPLISFFFHILCVVTYRFASLTMHDRSQMMSGFLPLKISIFLRRNRDWSTPFHYGVPRPLVIWPERDSSDNGLFLPLPVTDLFSCILFPLKKLSCLSDDSHPIHYFP